MSPAGDRDLSPPLAVTHAPSQSAAWAARAVTAWHGAAWAWPTGSGLRAVGLLALAHWSRSRRPGQGDPPRRRRVWRCHPPHLQKLLYKCNIVKYEKYGEIWWNSWNTVMTVFLLFHSISQFLQIFHSISHYFTKNSRNISCEYLK